MAKRRGTDLGQLLVGLRLVTDDQLAECRNAVGRRASDDELLEILQRRQYLTSYQVGRIQKNETDGLVLGGYRLLYRVGAGTFARVFRAQSIDSGATVALKVLRERWSDSPDMVATFRREAEVCRRFQHDNIVRIHDVAQDRGIHFMTMEFVEGGTLSSILSVRKRMDPTEATRCILEICHGLEYALQKGMTHRDLKTTNVLISSDGVAKLVDFGLAGAGPGAKPTDHEVAGQALEYSTLERATNAPASDPRTDLFFAGAIYYQLLAGEPPWPPTKDRAERRRIDRYTRVVPLSRADPQLPHCVTGIVDRMMQFNPNERYQSATDIIRDLQRALVEIGTAPRTGSAPEPAPPRSESKDATKGTIVFVENRDRHREILRPYFSEQGYRVMLVSHPSGAMMRLQSSSPPDAVVLMAESVGDEAPEAFRQLAQRSRRSKSAALMIVSRSQARDWESDLGLELQDDVLVQPVTLKQLRQAVAERLGHSDE